MRVVVALDELGSVRAAADALSLTPSAVSKQLQRAEGLLGRTLFVRSRQGVAATAEGADLAVFGRRFLEFVDEVGVRFDRETVHGSVRLGITDDVGLTHVPGILQDCAVRFPGLEVQLTVGFSSELIQAMAQQTLDMALVSDGGGSIPAGATLLRDAPMVWVARRGAARPGDPLPPTRSPALAPPRRAKSRPRASGLASRRCLPPSLPASAMSKRWRACRRCPPAPSRCLRHAARGRPC